MSVFNTRAKVCNLNDHSNDIAHFDMCMQNYKMYIAIRDLNDSILDRVYAKLQNVHRDSWFELRNSNDGLDHIWIAHNFKLRIAMWVCVHMVQNTVIRMIIQIAQFKFKLQTIAPVWKQSKVLLRLMLLDVNIPQQHYLTTESEKPHFNVWGLLLSSTCT